MLQITYHRTDWKIAQSTTLESKFDIVEHLRLATDHIFTYMQAKILGKPRYL